MKGCKLILFGLALILLGIAGTLYGPLLALNSIIGKDKELMEMINYFYKYIIPILFGGGFICSLVGVLYIER